MHDRLLAAYGPQSWWPANTRFEVILDRLAAMPSAALRTRLLALPGVGPETADAIMLYALGHPVPVADEYLRRIAERHKLLDPPPGRNRRGYDSLVQLTAQAFAADPKPERTRHFNELHALTVAVGKAHCGKSPKCEECPLAYDLEHANNRK
jgi:endonuclease III related protein